MHLSLITCYYQPSKHAVRSASYIPAGHNTELPHSQDIPHLSMRDDCEDTVWLLIFEGFRCFRGCIHDLRKLKKYQNFDPKNADSAMTKFSS